MQTRGCRKKVQTNPQGFSLLTLRRRVLLTTQERNGRGFEFAPTLPWFGVFRKLRLLSDWTR